MMNHPETSLYMSYVLNLSKRNLLKDGYAYPIVAVLNKGRDPRPHLKHELLMDEARFVMKDLEMVEDESFVTDTEELVYAYIYLFRVRKSTDEDQMEFITKTLCRTGGDPDAIGLISCCVYNEYSDPDNVTREQILADPDVTRIIVATYYLKGDPVRRDSVTPYINRGQITTEIPSLSDEIKQGYEVLAAHSGWYAPGPNDIRKIKNPYNYK